MPSSTKPDAEAVAKKLRRGGKSNPKPPLTISDEEKSGHRIIKVFYDGRWIGQFGIRRGKRDLNHSYIADQLWLTRQQAFDFARCPLTVEEYVDILREKHII